MRCCIEIFEITPKGNYSHECRVNCRLTPNAGAKTDYILVTLGRVTCTCKNCPWAKKTIIFYDIWLTFAPSWNSAKSMAFYRPCRSKILVQLLLNLWENCSKLLKFARVFQCNCNWSKCSLLWAPFSAFARPALTGALDELGSFFWCTNFWRAGLFPAVRSSCDSENQLQTSNHVYPTFRKNINIGMAGDYYIVYSIMARVCRIHNYKHSSSRSDRFFYSYRFVVI